MIERSLTPPQFAKRYGRAVEKVIRWIESGELVAINVATTTSGRPRYVITPEAIEEFEKRRRVKAAPVKKTIRRKRATPAGYVRYFEE